MHEYMNIYLFWEIFIIRCRFLLHHAKFKIIIRRFIQHTSKENKISKNNDTERNTVIHR